MENSMRKSALILAMSLVLPAAIRVYASGPIVVYALVEKVVIEPNESKPERIQIWGSFSLQTDPKNYPDRYSAAQRGYLYYRMDHSSCSNADCISRLDTATRTMWSDLKKVAGTGQAVGFGGLWPFSEAREVGRVRKADDKSTSPDVFPDGNPVVKLGVAQSAVIARLKAALAVQSK
jgi:hypothetical protein